MPDSTTIVAKAENRPRYTPARVLAMFVLALGATTVMTVIQKYQRESLERTEAPTGVGDRLLFVLRRPDHWGKPVGQLDGKPLYLASVEPMQRRDIAMSKVAWLRQFHVYEDEAGERFVKVGEGQYLPLTEERSSPKRTHTPPA